MRTLLFDAPANHTFVPDPEKMDEVYNGGQTFEVSDDRAEELLTGPGTANLLKEVGEDTTYEESNLDDLTRKQLNELARSLAISKPEDIPGGKPAVIAAIEAAHAARPETGLSADPTNPPDTAPEGVAEGGETQGAN